jgi:hypothetical protein
MARSRLFWTLSWLAAGWIAWEFLYYSQFKLNGAEGSIQGVFLPLANWIGAPALEPQLRWGVVLLEIAAVALVLNTPTRLLGGLMTMGLMGGAIFLHVVGPIGIDPYGDGGVLFKEACFTLAMGAWLAWAHREDGRHFLPRGALA